MVIEVVRSGVGLLGSPVLGEDIYVLWRLLEVYGSWEEARRWIVCGSGIASLVELRPRALLWHSPQLRGVDLEAARRCIGHLYIVGYVSRRLERLADVATYVSAYIDDPTRFLRVVSISRDGERVELLVPRDFPYIEEYRAWLISRFKETVNRLRLGVDGRGAKP